MLQLATIDFLLLAPTCFSLVFLTLGYFIFNTTTSFVKSNTKDRRVVKIQVSKKNYNFVLINFIIALSILSNVQIIWYFGITGSFWCNHLYINTFIYKYISLFLKISLFIFIIFYNLAVSRIYLSVDYIYSTSILLFVAPVIFLCNNFFVFYFLLELIVCLTFFKFVVSRFWYKSPLQLYTSGSVEKYSEYTPKMFLNMLFFQYWVSFFSSILLLYFFINLEFLFSSTEWAFLNFSIQFLDKSIYLYLYFFIFIVAFFLKLGITPLHLYKIEVYKGLPYVSLYIYTIFFFIIYFFIFVILLLNNLYNFIAYFVFTLILLAILGMAYVISMLFDINFIKAFFAYSTIINIISFLLVVISAF